jgi:putative Holliday junction resolvase
VRRGVRIGVDVGSVRIGVAASDPGGLLAVPLETVARDGSDLDRIAAIALERDAIELVVGLPRTLAGVEGSSAQAVRDYSVTLAGRVAPRVVRLVDERLTTVSAEHDLRKAGVRGRRARTVVDQLAAAAILQAALDAERSTGTPPGETVPLDRLES